MEEDMENNELSKNTCQLEEDIKILEELIEPFREQNRKGKKLILDIKGIKYEHYEAIENLISRYKELEEGKALTKKQEAMILKAIKQSAEEQITKEMKNYIPKSKVQEKIEDYTEKSKHPLVNAQSRREYTFGIKALKELLEES